MPHRTILALGLGAAIALVLNKTIAGILNPILSIIGVTYA